MAFKIRRGTNAERLTITPAQGELIYTTDTKKLYVGDGTTVGGTAVDTNLPIDYDQANILYLEPINQVQIGRSSDTSVIGGLTIHQYTATGIPILYLINGHNNADGNNVTFLRHRGTATARLPVQQNDEIIDFNFFGSDTANTIQLNANFTSKVDGPVSAGIVPGAFEFSVRNQAGALNLHTKMDSEGVLRSNKISSLGTNTNLEITRNGTGRLKLNGLNFPNGDGSSGNLLSTNGAGELGWVGGIATTSYVDTAISNIIDGSPDLLNTLNELAAAVADDENFATTVSTALGKRVRFDDVQSLTASEKLVVQNNIGLDAAALQSDWTQSDNTARDFIKNKPTIPAAQVKSDWNSTTGLSEILNKPTIPNLAALAQSILPATDVTYDLGSASKRFRDLYLSGSTIDLGGKTLSISGGTLSVGGNKFGESGNVVGVAITQFYNNTVYIRLDVGSDAETIANSIVKGDILKLDPAVGQTTQLTVVSNDGGTVDTNNTAFKDYYITVAEIGPGSAVNIFFDLVKPIASDVNQLQDADGLLDRTMITTGVAPGSSAVASANSVDINFSDGVGNKFKFNRDGKITFAAPQYGTSVTSMYVDYGFRFRPTWNGTGTGPELAVSWNDGIELTPITNDHFTGSNRATPFFIQGTYTDQAGKLPGNVYIDGGRNGPADVNGDVLIGSGYTKSTIIGQSNATIYVPGSAGQAANEAVQIKNIASASSVLQLFGRGEVQVVTNTGATEKVFTFLDDGKLKLPAGGDIVDSAGFSVLGSFEITGDQNVDGGGGAVDVWNGSVYTGPASVKLLMTGQDVGTGETQSCEVLLTKKGGSQLVSLTVYAVVHTSTDPLFTVSAIVEPTGQIKVRATVPVTIATVNIKSIGRETLL